jgi:magnesium-transporting ATPase (P-type)
MVHAGIVVSQFFVSLAVRTDRQSLFRVGLFSNPQVLAAGALSLCAMAAISYVPALQGVFHTAPLRPADWALLFGLGVFLLTAEEVRKWWRRHHDARANTRQKGSPA